MKGTIRCYTVCMIRITTLAHQHLPPFCPSYRKHKPCNQIIIYFEVHYKYYHRTPAFAHLYTHASIAPTMKDAYIEYELMPSSQLHPSHLNIRTDGILHRRDEDGGGRHHHLRVRRKLPALVESLDLSKRSYKSFVIKTLVITTAMFFWYYTTRAQRYTRSLSRVEMVHAARHTHTQYPARGVRKLATYLILGVRNTRCSTRGKQ